MENKTSRREFLKQMALTGVALAGLPAISLSGAEAKPARSKIVIGTNKAMLSGGSINKAEVDETLGKCLMELTDTSSPKAAWKSIFSAKDIVGIKVNGLFGKGVATHPEVAFAVARGLILAGVKPGNIIIWDRSTSDLIKSGYSPNRDGDGVRCYGEDDNWGEEIHHGSFNGRISRILSKKVTAFVNVPILKTHGMAGISCCLKNHYGSFSNPGDHHANYCNPPLADFSAIPVVKNKSRLVVIDALIPQYDGGPGLNTDAQFKKYSLITGFDPVAADYEGLQIIQKQREKVGLNRIPGNMTAWLESADERGVGTCNPNKIDLVKV